jgi:uncharacterized FlaG/YvyC family protein
MANEISSMVMAARTPTPTQNSGQFVQLESARVSEAGGESLPQQGQPLPQPAEKSASKVDLQEVIGQINSYVQSVKRDLSFSLDETSGRTIIRVIDSDSGKLVRQIPSEEVLALASYLQGVQQGATAVDVETPKGILFSDIT